MNVNVSKIILYVALVILVLYSGRGFLSRYSRMMEINVDTDPLELLENNAPVPATPTTAGETNNVETPPAAPTEGEPADPTPAAETAAGDGDVSGDTNVVQQAVPPPATRKPEGEMLTKRAMERGGPSADISGLGFYAFALFGTLLGLGFLTAHDISTFMGQKAHKLLHNEEGEGIHSASYDQAEEVWANGDYLEAIRLMREYLAKNPREVHVMARIAEIYEKDLGNFLAAALEYEEFLGHKIPAERWAWSAIHLVNLYYGKLDKPDQGLALLWRIHREYGRTQAAAKARKRLLQIDPSFASEQARLDREAAEGDAGTDEAEEDVESVESPTETSTRVYQLDEADLELPPQPAGHQPPVEDADSNLPKGFRPKKR